ncbi:MAG: glycoside hydrolase family 18 protein [Alphaproteobacteria bacterium]|nr:glycoside hydrolase family 18 protein [Alphaproteobacteria bacterium]
MLAVSAALAVLCALLLVSAYAVYTLAPAGPQSSGGPNAVWAAHKWVGDFHSVETYDALAADLQRNGITDVYFHVGPLDGDGLIPRAKYRNAPALLAAMRIRDPAIRLHAWIGQVERRAGGPLDLSDAGVRGNIRRAAEGFLETGFDGIHYNIEPIRSGDRDLLALLDATRAATRAHDALLSMATDELEPFPGAQYLLRPLARRAGLWSPAYYRDVALRLDQIAVMMYDTASPWDWLYGAIVAYETWRLAGIAGPDTTLFMGVPTYEDEHFGFRPEAENMGSGLRGIRIGLHYAGAVGPDHFGAAVYAGWTTKEAEWATWRRQWLGQPG